MKLATLIALTAIVAAQEEPMPAGGEIPAEVDPVPVNTGEDIEAETPEEEVPEDPQNVDEEVDNGTDEPEGVDEPQEQESRDKEYRDRL